MGASASLPSPITRRVLDMTTCHDSPLPGIRVSFKNLILDQSFFLARQIELLLTMKHPILRRGVYIMHYLLILVTIILTQMAGFFVFALGYAATTVIARRPNESANLSLMEIEQGPEGLAAVLLLGFAARWIAWRLHLPSILLLLMAGILAGPGTLFLRPDEMLGPILLPFVSISVALILFEGGLGLSFRDLKGGGGVIRNLVTLGAAVTWAAAAPPLTGFSTSISHSPCSPARS